MKTTNCTEELHKHAKGATAMSKVKPQGNTILVVWLPTGQYEYAFAF